MKTATDLLKEKNELLQEKKRIIQESVNEVKSLTQVIIEMRKLLDNNNLSTSNKVLALKCLTNFVLPEIK